jgi:hypothetical protein
LRFKNQRSVRNYRELWPAVSFFGVSLALVERIATLKMAAVEEGGAPSHRRLSRGQGRRWSKGPFMPCEHRRILLGSPQNVLLFYMVKPRIIVNNILPKIEYKG